MLLTLALLVAACSSDPPAVTSELASQSSTSTTTLPVQTTTTELPATSTTAAPSTGPAVVEALAACEWGDSQRPGTENMRTLLEDYTGESTDEFSDDEVFDAWLGYVRRVGEEAADHAMFEVTLDAYRTAVDHAARASALDERWADLHQGISNYLSYLESPVPGSASSDEVMTWFEQTRLACERARSLT